MPRPAKKSRYHHGDLATALIDKAIELIDERGVSGFSLAEASRRLGVTVAAPYRHFADRDELLASVAVRAVHALAEAVAGQVRPDSSPAEQLAAVAAGYVRFAVDRRPLFQVLFGAGLDKRRYPELATASEDTARTLLRPALVLCGGDEAAAADLGTAIGALAHGYAMFLLDGTFGAVGSRAEAVAGQARTAALALATSWPGVRSA
ncbi:MAG TPA: TetR/AcrR family transcriptional regulator [Pseudonocardiaceae bacterium]|jgi:AcrR family transcriptional regulator|nr:TetR/AcrR family transcriptional regulator [Pseudonocardiaceae bacterium]